MSRARVTINATVLAAAVRIDARLKSNIGTVVARDNRLRGISKEKSPNWTQVFIDLIRRLFLNMKCLETIGWIDRGAAGVIGTWMDDARRLGDFAHIFPELPRVWPLFHMICSHEHEVKSNPICP